MKKTALLLIVLLASIHLFSQNGISFQGIARDQNGNALVKKEIQVKFTIGSFIEEQKLTTDDYGVFSATIGSENTTGFNKLVFANTSYSLKVDVDGNTIYDDKFNTVPYSKAAENGVPVGCIMPFAGSVTSGGELLEPITGWLVCNGAALTSDAKFTKLKNVLGNSWGTNRVPDLRGVFLRGVNNERADEYKDPDERSVGNFQLDDNKEHNHSGTTSSTGEHTHTTSVPDEHAGAVAAYNYTEEYYRWDLHGDVTSSSAGNHSHSLNIDISGSESRPKNAAVVYIIKY